MFRKASCSILHEAILLPEVWLIFFAWTIPAKLASEADFYITRALRFELRNKSLELFILPLNYTLNNHCMILFKCIFLAPASFFKHLLLFL